MSAKSAPAFSLDLALALVDAARSAAREHNLPGISIVVLDVDGAVRASVREDMQGTFGVAFAQAKARTALGFLRSSLFVSKTFKDSVAISGLAGAVGGDLVPLGGGVVVNDAEGRRIGAAAVAGGPPDVDHEIICAAVAKVGLQVQD